MPQSLAGVKLDSLIRRTIEAQLQFEPEVKTRNRNPLQRSTVFGARWELRFGPNNRFRVFYQVNHEDSEVSMLAIGVRKGERLYRGGREVELGRWYTMGVSLPGPTSTSQPGGFGPRIRYTVTAGRIRQAFEFDPERIEHLVQRLRPSFEQVKVELLAFADFLDELV